MLEGLDWEGCARLGCKTAAGKVRRFGSREGLPDREQFQSWLTTIRKG
jgi:sugar/nucleoside kinase (ribokinase family)